MMGLADPMVGRAMRLAALAAGLVAAAADGGWASPRGDGASALFERLDLNGDSRLTAAELEAGAAERFMRMDADGDARVTRDEARESRARSRAARAAERFAAADADGDGALDAAEIDAAGDRRLRRWLSKADADGDGRVTETELGAMSGERRGSRREARRFERLDRDGDGALSAEEHAAGAVQLMRRLDRDGDGAVSLDEARRWREAGRGKGRRLLDGREDGARARP